MDISLFEAKKELERAYSFHLLKPEIEEHAAIIRDWEYVWNPKTETLPSKVVPIRHITDPIDDEDTGNFIYDIRSGLVLFNFYSGAHESWSSSAYQVIKKRRYNAVTDDAAYDYVANGYGILLSSVAETILLPSHFYMSKHEEMVFSNYQGVSA